jgi:hypothetical protein
LPLAHLGRWQGQITAEIFPTISDSERVKMRQNRFSAVKTKRAFHHLFAMYIGVLMKFSKMANTFSNPVGHPSLRLNAVKVKAAVPK